MIFSKLYRAHIPKIFNQFQRVRLHHNNAPSVKTPTGLFRNPALSTPQGFKTEANKVLKRVGFLVQRISNATTDVVELRKVVKNLDRLSDLLCSVIDTAEFVRNSHPDQNFVNAANDVYEELCFYMNSLNTNTDLYKVLNQVLSTPDITAKFSPEELQVAKIFLRDFEKSGVNLPSSDREQYVQLSNKIITLGQQFIHPPLRVFFRGIKIDESKLDGLPLSYHKDLVRRKNNDMFLYISQWSAQIVLKYIKDEEIRKQMYTTINSASKEQIQLLEDLLKTRAELAKLIGMKSYGDVFISDKMLKKPEYVQTFLRSFADHHKQKALSELQTLREAKQQFTKDKELPIVYAWDRDFYTEKIKSSSQTQQLPPISSYFSVESVIEGLSCLFSRLYGISFEASEILPGEAWCEDIYKFDVIDEKEGKVGTIYCDLFNRFGKLQTAAHYTVRCSRRVDDDDALGDLPSGYDPAELDDLATSDPGAIVNGRPGRYQLPIVVLTCDFAKSKDQNVPTLLNLIEVETLFHEMGHAMHSMIGRTDFHNVSGTRCPTDFVELPSILMEHFVYSPSVLSLFAKHYETKEPLPLELIQHYSKERLQFTAIETQSQIVMSLLDQLYHSSIVSRESSPNFDTTSILANLQDTVGLFPSVPGTAWQTQFFHLFGYGAGYYSYLFCRTLAGKIWKDLFEKDPLSREAGERFKEELLKWGGSKDPWICIGRTLRDERIMNGDSKSVAIVGEWRKIDKENSEIENNVYKYNCQAQQEP
ncbi:3870_t:CDS:2 [Entrophospora sp. SA101]|nr:3870_t:CDS:2 [Entrophospora sp. SA101]